MRLLPEQELHARLYAAPKDDTPRPVAARLPHRVARVSSSHVNAMCRGRRYPLE